MLLPREGLKVSKEYNAGIWLSLLPVQDDTLLRVHPPGTLRRTAVMAFFFSRIF